MELSYIYILKIRFIDQSCFHRFRIFYRIFSFFYGESFVLLGW